MSGSEQLDAVVVGAGPNGLAAAITLARAGRSVRVYEAAATPGGGARSAELTLPGYVHDVCSAIHPLASATSFMASLDLEGHQRAGASLSFAAPEVDFAHPIGGDRAGAAYRSLDATIERLGTDGKRWEQLVGWVAERWDRLADDLFTPITELPKHPLSMAGFGARAALPATISARGFSTPEASGLFAGAAAHSFLPLHRPLTTTFGLLLGGAAHVAGWPSIKGGSQELIRVMVDILESLGGDVVCDRPVRSLADLPESAVVLFDLTPRQVLAIAGAELSARDRRTFSSFRHGPGVFKVDYALSEPVPWTAEVCRRAGTVHVGGTIDEIDAAESLVAKGTMPERPFVLVAQHSIFDDSRTPDPAAGEQRGHTLWTYAHVPNGCPIDVTDAIEQQIERFAPGFRDTIVARHTASPSWYEQYNENNVGGDIGGGAVDGLQLFARPGLRRHPYRTGNPRLFLCSSSTPPGGGVHGLCGHNAALDALRSTLA
ncbi:MAG: NAD(P)/FAD-dependent oxidoreductase [Acidimicrobiales bacterium]